MSGPHYAELQVTSHFSFLRGASSCDELFAQAALLGIFEEPDIVEVQMSRAAPTQEAVRDIDRVPVIATQGLVKRFGALEVLKGIDFEAHEGEVISILGASGSGKSTFLRCLNLLELPSGGHLQAFGEEIRLRPRGNNLEIADTAQVDQLRTRVAMVFQNFCLWSHKTVLQNLMEGPIYVQGRARREVKTEAEEVLARVGLGDRADYYPAQLSGGQQQRAAIARALVMKPRALLFDEPTSSLDPELVGEVLKVMRDLASEGRTMLIVTHEMAFARDVSSRTLFLEKGEIRAQGSPAELFSGGVDARFDQFIGHFSKQA